MQTNSATAPTSANNAQNSASANGVFLPALRDSFHLLWPILKSAPLVLIALHLIAFGASQYFSFATETVMAEGKENLFFLALNAGLELLFSLMWSAAWTLVLVSAAEKIRTPHEPPKPLTDVFFKNFNQLVVEQIRVLAGLLWRLPLLLLPSLVFYIRTTLVPYVVLLDPRYHRGQVDALKESQYLSRRRFWVFFLVVLVSHLLPWLAEDIALGPNGPSILQNPWRVAFSTVLTLFIQLWIGIFLFSIARRLIRITPLKTEPAN